MASRSEDVEFDPARLEAVETRLDTLYSLEQKYHVESVAQLLSLQGDIERQLIQIDGGDEELHEMEARLATLLADSEQKAMKLTDIRTNAARKVEAEMRQRLVPLGIPKVRFEVQLQEKPLASDGHDKVAFLFTANSNTPLQPVAQVASGGEVARVMLSLKAMISGAVKLPTIIFDEIDTGVSGKVAQMMAHIMEEMGDNDRQVISITHLPQIAAKGARHYKVYKEEGDEGTTSHMRLLSHDERVREIAQMVSGSDISEAAIRNAEENAKLTMSIGKAEQWYEAFSMNLDGRTVPAEAYITSGDVLDPLAMDEGEQRLFKWGVLVNAIAAVGKLVSKVPESVQPLIREIEQDLISRMMQ